ncbi:ATP-binding protein [Ancylobacter dichloromethanicus]|uniref:ATP-binding protein n=1 Tax=Ancylobacter dichloromethanicus TaxID=518825 RepID=UPI00361FBA09
MTAVEWRRILPSTHCSRFSTKPAESGSGLGLPTAYGFARQSGGNLLIESEAGVGTRVTLLLPALPPNP